MAENGERKTVEITFRATQERHRQLKQACLNRDQSLQSMIEEGLVIILGESGAAPIPPKGDVVLSVPKAIAKRVQRFAEILGRLTTFSPALRNMVEQAEGILLIALQIADENGEQNQRVANGGK